MRWDNLFDDLESQLEHELTAEEVDLRAEEERLRLARISLRDRIVTLHEAGSTASVVSNALRVQLTNGLVVTVHPLSFGRDWFTAELLEESRRPAQCLVPISAIAALLLDRRQVQQSLETASSTGRSLSHRLGLAFALRDLCRRRSSVELLLGTGVAHGTIDRVGRDHLDLAVHEAGSVRRETAVSHYRVVPFEQLLLVRM
ncbi:MAG TPA: hypothetical protein VN619_10190 [Lacisediminihabitans sp.]|nr:hypothetical protein [Lacisediminihabitans sp.]HXD62280.1 hypothetical protein [Lacisediminihabitans sp.]